MSARLRQLLRATAMLALLLVLSGAAGSRIPAHAQTISSVELAAVALDDGDVPGYVTVAEPDAMVPANFDAAFTRVLYASDLSGGLLVVNLSAAGPLVPAAALRQVAASGMILRMLAADPTKSANFRTTGPLGTGEADMSGVWDGYDVNAGNWHSVYGDTFLRGWLLVTVFYVAPLSAPDPALIGRAALVQDGKIMSSQTLPGSVQGQ